MPQDIFFDTRNLVYFFESPYNYCHFLYGNLIEVYISLKENNLLDQDIRITIDNPSANFIDFYSIFTPHPVSLGTAPPENAKTIVLNSRCNWRNDAEKALLEPHMKEFADFVRSKIVPEPRTADTITIIKRNPFVGKRYVINHWFLIRSLRKTARKNNLKVRSVDFASMNCAEQVALMAETRILIGTHGAGFANTVFMDAGSAAVEIFPNRKFQSQQFNALSRMAGIHHFKFKSPSFSILTLYNIALLLFRRGHSKKNKFYRDRNILISSDRLIKSIDEVITKTRSADTEPGCTEIEHKPARRWRDWFLLLQHPKFIVLLLLFLGLLAFKAGPEPVIAAGIAALLGFFL